MQLCYKTESTTTKLHQASSAYNELSANDVGLGGKHFGEGTNCRFKIAKWSHGTTSRQGADDTAGAGEAQSGRTGQAILLGKVPRHELAIDTGLTLLKEVAVPLIPVYGQLIVEPVAPIVQRHNEHVEAENGIERVVGDQIETRVGHPIICNSASGRSRCWGSRQTAELHA